jgi:very-short-patch-repair endonuclease
MKNSHISMFYGASPIIFEMAKRLRNNMTLAEKLLWGKLSDNKLNKFRFKAQHPIHNFIADFYCHPLKLVIELDGGIHELPENKEYDVNRGYAMREFGIEVVRFKNEEVFDDIN